MPMSLTIETASLMDGVPGRESQTTLAPLESDQSAIAVATFK